VSETEGAIQIFALKEDVARVNKENIDLLTSELHEYMCLDNFAWNDDEDPTLEEYTWTDWEDPTGQNLYHLV